MALQAPTNARAVSYTWNQIGVSFDYPADADTPDHFELWSEPMGGTPVHIFDIPGTARDFVLNGTTQWIPPLNPATDPPLSPVLYAADTASTRGPSSFVDVAFTQRPMRPLPAPTDAAFSPGVTPDMVIITWTAPDAAQIRAGVTLDHHEIEYQDGDAWVALGRSPGDPRAVFQITDSTTIPAVWRPVAVYSTGDRVPGAHITR